MALQSERRRGKRAYEREERLHFWKHERIEHSMPHLFDLHWQLDTLRKHMEDALHEAIEDANAPGMRYRAANGELRSLQGENYRYTFRLQAFWEPQDETPVKIQIDPHDPEHIIDGTIIETDGAVLHLATEAPLPSHVLSGILLYEDTNWLLQQLLSAIKTVRETSAQMGAKTFGVIDGLEGNAGKDTMQTSLSTFTPDKDQQQALWRGRFCEILRLIGPPGTGKTRTLTALAWYYLRQGMTVLLLSQTNVAVDNAVMSLQTLCQETGHVDWISGHRIVRVGNVRDLDAERYRDVIHASIVDQELGVLADERDALKMEERALISEKAEREQERNQMREDLNQGNGEINTIEQQIEWLNHRRDAIKDRLKDIEREQRLVKERVASEADLIATTLTSVYTSPYLKGRYFDCVILDEASMASLPAVLVAATHATQHVAIIGDPLQFAPIAGLHNTKKYPKAAQWLGTDLFSYLKITVEQARQGKKQAVFLSQQSQMDPDIARAVSQYIYQGQLKNRERQGYVRPAFDPLPESAWIVVDTSDAPPAACCTQRPANGKSKFNDYHVQCVLQLIKAIIASEALPFEPGQPQIGIVTPYAPQARKIREALQQQGLDHHARVGTIFAFQGREFEIVIVDLVESPGTPIPRFTSDIWGRDDVATPATRLINVAHSRARSKLIYVTNVEYHRRQSGKNHVLLQFINDAVASGRLASHDLFLCGD